MAKSSKTAKSISAQKPPARVRVPTAKKAAQDNPPDELQNPSTKKAAKKSAKGRGKTKRVPAESSDDDEAKRGTDDEPEDEDGDKVECVSVYNSFVVV
jgi:hypothetical protein